MIKEITCYSVVCDNCGKDSNEGTEFVGWSNKEAALDTAEFAEFITEGDKHYCSDCYSYDETDTIEINAARKNKFNQT